MYNFDLNELIEINKKAAAALGVCHLEYDETLEFFQVLSALGFWLDLHKGFVVADHNKSSIEIHAKTDSMWAAFKEGQRTLLVSEDTESKESFLLAGMKFVYDCDR